jgi:hypothetical protein
VYGCNYAVSCHYNAEEASISIILNCSILLHCANITLLAVYVQRRRLLLTVYHYILHERKLIRSDKFSVSVYNVYSPSVGNIVMWEHEV